MLPALRPWQIRAIEAYINHRGPNFLIVATPGAGKTRAAGEIARRELAAGRADFVVVVCPSLRLKFQWMHALAELDIQINPEHERADFARLARDYNGVAVTYHQVASSPDLFRGLSSRHNTLVVLDEIHHCGDDLPWGDGVRRAFEPCVKRLSLSGTPWRSTSESIPFVNYVDGTSVPEISYGYADALADTPPTCRPVYFPITGGKVAWSERAGQTREVDFEEKLNERDANTRLRTAVNPDMNLVREQLREANDRLMEMRHEDHDAGGLVVCERKEQAAGIARLLRNLGADPEVVHSDVRDAHERIDRFARSTRPWLVAVDMVSEGVDIPRLRVGVYCTVKTTELAFRQIVGRFVRVEPDAEAHNALMFIPQDSRLVRYAEQIKAEVAHFLAEETDRLLREGDGEREPSSIVPLSAEGEYKGTLVGDTAISAAELDQAERFKMRNPETAALPTETVALLLRAAGVHPSEQDVAASAEPPLHQVKKELLRANSNIAKRIAYAHEVEHAIVNATLNRLIGVRSVKQADVPQLRRRLAAGQTWLRDGEPPQHMYA